MLALGLFGSENNSTDESMMKSKIKIKEGIGSFSLSIPSRKLGLNRNKTWLNQGSDRSSEAYRYDSHYLTHISASIDDVSVFDASLSPYLSTNPMFRIKFKDFTDSDDITYVLTNNHGKKIQQSFKIDRKDSLKNPKASLEQKRVNPITLNPKAWAAVTVDSAIETVFPHYSTSKMDINKISFLTSRYNSLSEDNCNSIEKDCVACTNIPQVLSINTKTDLRTIAIFSTTTPKPLLAFIQLPDNGFVDIIMPFQLDKP